MASYIYLYIKLIKCIAVVKCQIQVHIDGKIILELWYITIFKIGHIRHTAYNSDADLQDMHTHTPLSRLKGSIVADTTI